MQVSKAMVQKNPEKHKELCYRAPHFLESAQQHHHASPSPQIEQNLRSYDEKQCYDGARCTLLNVKLRRYTLMPLAFRSLSLIEGLSRMRGYLGRFQLSVPSHDATALEHLILTIVLSSTRASRGVACVAVCEAWRGCAIALPNCNSGHAQICHYTDTICATEMPVQSSRGNLLTYV
jgi:hypothetical protein